MMETKKINLRRGGFSIVELLTVMGIIAILLGLLVPALSQVRDKAMELKQKAQFHSIETGLELFKNGEGGLNYPESNDNSVAPINTSDPTPYCGANKLAEALVGLDYLGFHPNSDFRADGMNDVILKTGVIKSAQPLYYYANGGSENVNWQTMEDNIKCRSFKLGTPFIDQEGANAFYMHQVYGDNALNDIGFNSSSSSGPYSMVLCDVYSKKRSSGIKTGTPILYYKARTQYIEQKYDDTNGIGDDIYYYMDNMNILELGSVDDPVISSSGTLHPLADGVTDEADFQSMILDQQLRLSGQYRPYRADSYILISAGKDGLFGTADDITNFEKTE